MKIQKAQGCNMIPSQTEVKYRGSSKFFAAWWPLFEGPADYLCQSGTHFFLKIFGNVCPMYHVVFVCWSFCDENERIVLK